MFDSLSSFSRQKFDELKNYENISFEIDGYLILKRLEIDLIN